MSEHYIAKLMDGEELLATVTLLHKPEYQIQDKDGYFIIQSNDPLMPTECLIMLRQLNRLKLNDPFKPKEKKQSKLDHLIKLTQAKEALEDLKCAIEILAEGEDNLAVALNYLYDCLLDKVYSCNETAEEFFNWRSEKFIEPDAESKEN